jgi:hypothetical protein
MKKTYKITIRWMDEIATIIMVNPPRKFRTVGYKEWSGAEIVAVERI